MKKLLLLIGLIASTAVGQDLRQYSYSFLPSGIDALYVTNTANITNLLTAGTMGTNFTGTAFTNLGSQVIVTTAGTTANLTASQVQLLNDLPLWSPRDGRNWAISTNVLGGDLYIDVQGNVSVTYDSGSGANAAVTFVMVPMMDDTHEANLVPWTWSFTAVASQTQATIFTNANFIYNWPGAKKVRVRRIVNADTDATSQVVITSFQLNHYR